MTRSIRSRLREIHGPDVEVTLVGRSDRPRAGAYVVSPAPAPHPSFKEVVNGVAIALASLPAMAFLLLLMAALFGVLTLIVYAGFEIFGAPSWLAWSGAAVVDLFALVVVWVNRK